MLEVGSVVVRFRWCFNGGSWSVLSITMLSDNEIYVASQQCTVDYRSNIPVYGGK